ncbi:MAG: hypothetical protein GF311_03475 [Candidatus Lokiarchaeota archaeon]|nr:hypothetical protein [Candidatus Lokiarchaeota archaeon]
MYEIFLRVIYNSFQNEFDVNAFSIEKLTSKINSDDQIEKKLYPDIILNQNDENIIYIDAKYKTKYSYRDYYQINTYLTQIDRIPYGELIYPKFKADQTRFIEGNYEKVKIRFIDLARISDRDYLKDFVFKTFKEYQK